MRVADKGYHSNQTLSEFADVGVRTYISEPDRGRRHWTGKAEPRWPTADVFDAGGACSASAGNDERPFAHGKPAADPSARSSQHPEAAPHPRRRLQPLLMRQLTREPRSLQGRAAAVVGALIGLLSVYWTHLTRSWDLTSPNPPIRRGEAKRHINPDTQSTRPFCHGLLGEPGAVTLCDALDRVRVWHSLPPVNEPPLEGVPSPGTKRRGER